jgi:transmembrane sensor
MNPSFQPPADASGLRRDVLDWFIRRQRDGWGAEDEAVFQAWLAADAGHGDAYRQWESNWNALDAVPADTVALLRRKLARDKAREAAGPHSDKPRHRQTPSSVPRRRFLMPAFAAAAFVAVATGTGLLAWNHWQAQAVFAQAFASQRGQQVEVPLPDGSRLRLDTATRLEVSYYRQRREVKLLEGQAVFSVQPDAARPFQVLAGPVGVTVVGTRFSVRYTPDLPSDPGVRVSVEQGKVHVARLDGSGNEPGEAPGSVYLTAGQQVLADGQGMLAPMSAVPGEGIAPWRDNRVSFVNTPLAQALAEFERYGHTGLTVRDPAVAALRLSGTFDPRDAQTLRRVLPAALPVRLQGTGESVELLPVR